MNWLDIVLLLIIAVSVIASFRKGLSREVIGFASVFLGLLLGIWFYGTASIYVQPYVSSPLAAKLIAVALLTGVMAFAKDGQPPEAVTHSRLAPYVSDGARLFVAIAPHELKEGFRKTYAEAKSAWNSELERQRHNRPKTAKDENEKRI
jgi:hypothetical protein